MLLKGLAPSNLRAAIDSIGRKPHHPKFLKTTALSLQLSVPFSQPVTLISQTIPIPPARPLHYSSSRVSPVAPPHQTHEWKDDTHNQFYHIRQRPTWECPLI